MAIFLSTAYLPPVAYVAAALSEGTICIEQYETFQKQSCRNHCEIFGPNGRQTLSVPVVKPHGNNSKTKDVRISQSLPWQRIHLRSILTAYNNSAFFLYFQDGLLPFYQKRYDFLVDLNEELLSWIFSVLKANVIQTRSDQFVPMRPDDPRLILSSKHHRPAFPAYFQPFSPSHGFQPNLSIIDLLFNLGTESKQYLRNVRTETSVQNRNAP